MPRQRDDTAAPRMRLGMADKRVFIMRIALRKHKFEAKDSLFLAGHGDQPVHGIAGDGHLILVDLRPGDEPAFGAQGGKVIQQRALSRLHGGRRKFSGAGARQRRQYG